MTFIGIKKEAFKIDYYKSGKKNFIDKIFLPRTFNKV